MKKFLVIIILLSATCAFSKPRISIMQNPDFIQRHVLLNPDNYKKGTEKDTVEEAITYMLSQNYANPFNPVTVCFFTDLCMEIISLKREKWFC